MKSKIQTLKDLKRAVESRKAVSCSWGITSAAFVLNLPGSQILRMIKNGLYIHNPMSKLVREQRSSTTRAFCRLCHRDGQQIVSEALLDYYNLDYCKIEYNKMRIRRVFGLRVGSYVIDATNVITIDNLAYFVSWYKSLEDSND